MSINDNGTGGAGNNPATPPAEQTVEYWQQQAQQATSRYNGMNGKFQQLQGQYAALDEQHKGAQMALNTASGDLLKHQTAVQEWERKYNDLTKQHGEVTGKLTEFEKAAATANSSLERLSLVAEKHRDLLDFWPMLKDQPGGLEDFEKAVAGFGDKLQAKMQSALKETLSGSTPPMGAGGPKDGAMDKDAAHNALDRLIKQGVTSGPEYEAAFSQWMTLNK